MPNVLDSVTIGLIIVACIVMILCVEEIHDLRAANEILTMECKK